MFVVSLILLVAASLQLPVGIDRSSSIISITQQLSECGMLRGTGRLHEADIADAASYPLILPQKSHFTQLVMRDAHGRLKHAGVKHVQTEPRQRLWIVNGRQAMKSWDFSCSFCLHRRASQGEQIIDPLLDYRLGKEMRAFACCRVDFAGPYLTQVTSRTTKRYLCLFTCMATHAVHLEMAVDLTADAFLPGFSNMIARAGKRMSGALSGPGAPSVPDALSTLAPSAALAPSVTLGLSKALASLESLTPTDALAPSAALAPPASLTLPAPWRRRRPWRPQ